MIYGAVRLLFMRHHGIIMTIRALKTLSILLIGLLLTASCTDREMRAKVDRLNELSYTSHYRDLAKTRYFANEALKCSDGYDAGTAEAYNNLAFVSIAKMQYAEARRYLMSAIDVTDNLVEQLVAEVQLMRLCQRQSDNKDFYTHMQTAEQLIKRICDEQSELDAHQAGRFVYAESEFSIVASTYFYYVGLDTDAADMLNRIDPNGPVVKDTAQLLNYYYNIGSGGILHDGTSDDICQAEFNYLVRCYLLSRQYNYPFWEANSMQALSEHLVDKDVCTTLMHNNPQEIEFLNVDNMPDSLLAGNLAYRSLGVFRQFGDVYQIAGAYRTLAQSYWAIRDYNSALICLNDALSDKRVERAPDLVASIREKLSMVYSAVDDKKHSDYNRNIYLDLQENTRQDRQLEARADMLERSAVQLNAMIVAVCLLIVLVIGMLVCFDYKRRHDRKLVSQASLDAPLAQWRDMVSREDEGLQAGNEELQERILVGENELERYKIVNLEQRTKVSLANSTMPLIDRIIREVGKLTGKDEASEVVDSRFRYLAELASKINEYNDSLTKWIKLRQGEVRLHIESFPLQSVFDVVRQNRTEFAVKGVELVVEPTELMVKADRVLTLFMVNTIVENARRFTSAGGTVRVVGHECDDCVEIVISDTGTGMTQEQMAGLFSKKVIVDKDGATSGQSAADGRTSHGFGLLNCKGIIDKYKKTSSLFSVCSISVDSEVGKGSKFMIRLPKGIRKTIMLIALLCGMSSGASAATDSSWALSKAGAFADSAYFSNVSAEYRKALVFADSCVHYLNMYYLKAYPGSKCLMRSTGDGTGGTAAEILWYRNHFKCNYNIILDIRNESAVAALALHEWDVYTYNNKVYTQLFRECSADDTLSDYVLIMQKSESNKNIAIFMLLALLLSIFPIYYMLYYRHRLYYRYAFDKVMHINNVLVSHKQSEAKLSEIRKIWNTDAISGNTQGIQRLKQVIHDIQQGLVQDIRQKAALHERSLSLTDELRRVEFEKDRYYVSNNVLENCLSALKHETMYYPSRIMQLVASGTDGVPQLKDVACYYRELYSVLSEQALRAVAVSQRVDYSLAGYMLSLLSQVAGVRRLATTEQAYGPVYVKLTARMDNMRLTQEQIVDLFTPSTTDFRFLVCRQIVREFGEQTNARGCGIQAYAAADGTLMIEITITNTIWKNLKLS